MTLGCPERMSRSAWAVPARGKRKLGGGGRLSREPVHSFVKSGATGVPFLLIRVCRLFLLEFPASVFPEMPVRGDIHRAFLFFLSDELSVALEGVFSPIHTRAIGVAWILSFPRDGIGWTRYQPTCHVRVTK